ncbi:MAG TPA: serine/threonine-protein kinase [Kofleriaceae bacterium]|nr:serine/threonine-protein kinase [Kofleriaceae bacterium]
MTRAIAEVGSTANSYEILAKLATGGMAELFLARGVGAAGVERYVVLKRVLRERAADVHFVRMFLDEARLAAQLQHPNVAQVYDIGKLGDSFFFTMEYVHGETVRALLHRSHALRSPIPIPNVLAIGAGAAAGLHHAHERIGMDGRPLGIVHRDVSPSNLMVSFEGNVKVVDFGVAKAAHRAHETRSGTMKGKISYMSPEQCRGAPLDRRSDLFSLGIVMWEMLTSERLYKRGSDFDTMAAIVSEPPDPPSRHRADVPRELDEIVLRLLAKSPDDRFQTGDELLERLEGSGVRTGHVVSIAALGRTMRELFGQRPEPWIELATQDTHAEAFTVTSEPIPKELAVVAPAELDLGLGAVPDLSASHRDSMPLQVPVPPAAPRSASASIAAAPRPRARRWPVVLAVALPAIAVAIAIALHAAPDHRDDGSTHVIAPPDAPVAIAMTPQPPPPPAPPLDAAEAAPPVAAAEAAPPVDAGEAPIVRGHPARRSGDELVRELQAGHYAEVTATCSASGALAAQNATACVLAACHVHDAAHARRWLAAAGSKRASLVAACRTAGTSLDAPAAKPDCAADPMSCQY